MEAVRGMNKISNEEESRKEECVRDTDKEGKLDFIYFEGKWTTNNGVSRNGGMREERKGRFKLLDDIKRRVSYEEMNNEAGNRHRSRRQ